LFKADLPIDCLKSETVGFWQFDISDLKYHEFYVENTCGHYVPDSYALSKDSLDIKKKMKFENMIKVELKTDGSLIVLNNDLVR